MAATMHRTKFEAFGGDGVVARKQRLMGEFSVKSVKLFIVCVMLQCSKIYKTNVYT